MWTKYKLADPAYYKSPVNIPQIDALLGIEACDHIVSGDVLRVGSIVLRNTKLDWTISSTIYPKPTKRVKTNTNSSFFYLCVDRDYFGKLKKLFLLKLHLLKLIVIMHTLNGRTNETKMANLSYVYLSNEILIRLRAIIIVLCCTSNVRNV